MQFRVLMQILQWNRFAEAKGALVNYKNGRFFDIRVEM
jgi:hypothetical protein